MEIGTTGKGAAPQRVMTQVVANFFTLKLGGGVCDLRIPRVTFYSVGEMSLQCDDGCLMFVQVIVLCCQSAIEDAL